MDGNCSTAARPKQLILEGGLCRVGGGNWAPWERQEEVCQFSYQGQQGKASREGTWDPRVIRVAVWRLAEFQLVGSELVRIEYVGLLLVCAGGGTLVYP